MHERTDAVRSTTFVHGVTTGCKRTWVIFGDINLTLKNWGEKIRPPLLTRVAAEARDLCAGTSLLYKIGKRAWRARRVEEAGNARFKPSHERGVT